MAKGKLTKRERDRKKREEEEKKLKELAELQRRAEQEELLQKEREQLQKEQEEANQRRLEKVLNVQKNETTALLIELEISICKARKERWERAVWDRYLECRENPDPEDIRQMNAYLSCSRENNEVNFAKVLEWVEEAKELTAELEWVMCHARHLPESVLSSCQEVLIQLQDLISHKLDRSSFHILKKASLNLDAETGNFYYNKCNQFISLCLWANLARNPRFKGESFLDGRFIFELPRSLAMVECAIRVLVVSFDHFSHHCSSYQHILAAPNSIDPRAYNDNKDEIALPPQTITTSVTVDIDHEEKEERDQKETPQAQGEPSSLSGLEVSGGSESREASISPAMTLPDEDDIDLRDVFVVGEVIHFDLVQIPSQPVTNPNWIIIRLEEPELLQQLPWFADYQPPVVSDQTEKPKKEGDETGKEQQQQQNQESKKLVSVTVSLLDSALWLEAPRVARWNPEKQVWSTKGFHDVTYKEDKSVLSFRTDRFGILSFLESKFVAFPFQSWELRSESRSSAMFNITTTSAVIHIKVMEGACSLQQVFSNDKYYLKEVYDEEMSPSTLFQKLQWLGLFLTPDKEAHKLTGNIRFKDELLENSIYQQMALISPYFTLLSSRWNSAVGQDKVILRCVENTEDKKSSMNLVMISKTHTTLLGITEISQSFSDKPADFNPEAADIYHLATIIGSQGIKNPLKPSHFLFIDTVYQLISTVRVLVCV